MDRSQRIYFCFQVLEQEGPIWFQNFIFRVFGLTKNFTTFKPGFSKKNSTEVGIKNEKLSESNRGEIYTIWFGSIS